MGRGFLTAGAIVALGAALGALAVLGRPSTIRRPDPAGRPVLLVPDFADQTGRPELGGFARELGDAVRRRLGEDRDGIFELSPRTLAPVLGARERETGLLSIAARLGADYVLVGSLEEGPGGDVAPGARWPPLTDLDGGDEAVRLDVLLVRDSEPPHVFAERFPLGDPPSDPGSRARLARAVADRIALSLRRP